MTHITTDLRRLGELHAGESRATEDEVKSLAESVANAYRRSGTKTLRDEFALAALIGRLSSGSSISAEETYLIADKMLEARK